jgi:hypothetical protein
MKTGKKTIAGIGVLFVILAFFFINLDGQDKYDEFAKCLTENGVKMYGAFWCSHCEAQKKSFGSSWEHVNYIECSTPDGQSQMPECLTAGIKGYPTWEFLSGERLAGEVSFKVLSEKTGCQLP